MLIVLDKNPYGAAVKVPKQLKHKQLLELMQMISCVVNFGYEKLPQGKKLKEWINNNKYWVYTYAKVLMQDLNLTKSTEIKYKCLLDLLKESCQDFYEWYLVKEPILKTAVFRYKKEYEDFTEYETDSELPIDVAVEEYQKYIDWKMHERNRVS